MKNKLTTTDIYFAAALLSLGAKLDDVDKADVRHMKFNLLIDQPHFKSENLQSAVDNALSIGIPIGMEYYENEWANGTLMVNGVLYKDAIQRLKSVIHSS